ncbi:WecB/TagA/CpsF family glycosyltransferase [Cryptosporangium sp. NPDC051539]|uniref:WecB/TagA/CpsF family glycosyltransferase n=1 Tax=Cryptosporangium sp. NPDC051539 TaxID=3363962 RepID=UPI0037BC1FB0
MTTSTRPGTFVCCGVHIEAVTRQPAAELVIAAQYGQPRSTHLCNAYTLSLAVRDPEFRALLNDADVNFADGHYVAMVGRRRGYPDMSARTYGPDLMADAIDQGRARGLKHYLYGASPSTVAQLADKLRERFPGAEFVGVESPPFRPLSSDEADELVARVAEAKPDVFWVGLGTPRQDEFVAAYTSRLNCTVVPVGAAFDFHAGNKPSAPEFLQRHGLEWAYRLATEPRRLWKRYLVGNPVFVYGALTDRWRKTP